MTISEIAVKHKPVIYILFAIIVIVGTVSYMTIPRESSPSITIPYIFISTTYPGASPQDMEQLVTQEIENQLKGVEGVKTITSTSLESFSSIIVEFNTDVQIDDALQKVRDQVSIAQTDLPDDCDQPEVSEVNLSELPILYVNLTGNVGLAELKSIADDLSDDIEGIDGVLSADVSGGLEREVKVDADANRMSYYNVAFGDIINAIQNENINVPGGSVNIEQKDFTVKVPGEYTDPTLIENIIIAKPSGDPIFIRDVADVTYGFEDRTTYSRENGKEAVTLTIKKRGGENIIDIIEKTKEVVETASLPEGVDISYTGDQSTNIRDTVKELQNGIITGFLLVVFVLYSAMGFRNSLLVASAIPVSFMIAFSALGLTDITLNIVVLFSLILVLGIIVDDAVVVNENIYRLQDKEGLTPLEAAVEGPREVQIPVFIATLTIISSFFPLLFFPGIVGEFMRYLPITIITCLFASLFVALVLNPAFSSWIINVKEEKAKMAKASKANIFVRYHKWFDRNFEEMTNKYEKLLRWLMGRRKTTIVAIFLFLIMIFGLYGTVLNTGIEFFPQVEPPSVYVNVSMPSGTAIEKTNEVTEQIEKVLPEFKDIEYYVTTVGQEINANFSSGGSFDQPDKSTIAINFYDMVDRNENTLVTVEQIRKAITGLTTAEVLLSEQQAGPPTGPPVNIDLYGDDYNLLTEYTDKIERLIKDIPGLTDLDDNLDRETPEIKFTVDREKASLYQLSTRTIAVTINTAVSGNDASTYRVGNNDYDITVRLDSAQRNNVQDLANLYVANKDNVLIPISSVADVSFTSGIGSIKRKDLRRVVTISANVASSYNADEVLKKVQSTLTGLDLPRGYDIKYSGAQEDQQESQEFLSKAFVMAILLVFFFLVIEFNNFSSTLIIMFSVVLSLNGVLIGLMITQMPFGIVMVGIGIISLAGIVVRNAIVLLDFQKELERRGMDRMESTIQSGKIRLRPVVLTAATTILGLIPLTTGYDFDWTTFHIVTGGENTAFWQPMGTTIIFGLAFATFLTLVIIPILYVSVNNFLDRVFKRKEKAEKEGKPDTGEEPIKPITT